MSYAALIPFVGGKPQKGIEFRNAWGGSARIWDDMWKTYVPKRHEHDSWISNPEDSRLWNLANSEAVQMFERAVHAFTFDRFYVRKEHFERMAKDLRMFVELHPAGGRVDHLPAWAKWLDDNADCEAVGVRGTSVSENPWVRAKICPHCGQGTDDCEPVPLSEGTEVYAWLESLKNPIQ